MNHNICKLYFGFLLLMLLGSMTSQNQLQAGCNGVEESDSLQLVTLYDSLGGENWLQQYNWFSTPVADWYGISLTQDGCHVYSIDLYNNNITGQLPDLQLPMLEYLELDYNHIEGEVPDFGGLPELRKLNFRRNDLSGQLPNFSNLPKLHTVYVDQNNLTGTPPSFSNCPLLFLIDLYDNQLVGPIPEFNLPILESLNLGTNNIGGELPSLAGLPSLQLLLLFENQLTGPLPDCVNNPELRAYNLRINQFTGSIPDLQLPLLNELRVDQNMLDGTVPNFSGLPMLGWLAIADNELVGNCPDFDQIPLVSSITLCPNNFEGLAPSFINLPLVDFEPEFFGPPDLSCFNGATFGGQAFYDVNGNCYFDEDEQALANVRISADGVYYAYTNEEGYYTLSLDIGPHEISAEPLNQLWDFSCPDQEVISMTAQEYSDNFGNINFGFQPVEYCSQHSLSLYNNLLRKCAPVQYYLQYCNSGTTETVGSYAELYIQEGLSITEATQPYTLTNDTLRFDLGEIPPAFCETIRIEAFIECDVDAGITVCSEAAIFPGNDCTEPLEVWDLSNVTVDGYCDEDSIHFTIKNVGEPMSEPNVYKCYEDDILSALDLYMLGENDSMVVSRLATGGTFRLRAYQNEGHPFQSFAQEVVEICGGGPWSLGLVNSQAAAGNPPYRDRHCGEVVASFDPNDKQVLPKGVDEEQYIPSSQDLTYKIRFQNTGTDTAFIVQLVDTIDTAVLDISTLRTTFASHDYYLNIEEGNIAKWTFENILLPDSTTNEQLSHGFIEFVIQQNLTNSSGTVIRNFADIYFDANEAVRTNSTHQTVCDEYGLEQFESLLSVDNLYLQEQEPTEETPVTISFDGTLVSNTISLMSTEWESGEGGFEVQLTFENTANECGAEAGIYSDEIELGLLSPGVYNLNLNSNYIMHGGSTTETFQFIVYPSIPSLGDGSVDMLCFEGQPDPINATGENIRWYSDSDLATLIGQGPEFTPEAETQWIYCTQTVNEIESKAESIYLKEALVPEFAELGPFCLSDLAPQLYNESDNEEPITGVWSPAEIDTNTPGIINYTFVPDSEFCSSIFRIDIEVVQVEVTVTYAEQVLLADSETAVQFDWYLNDDLYLENEVAITAPQSGTYHVVATDDNGCSASSEDITISLEGVSIGELHQKSLSVFPNPANEYFSFDTGSSESWELTVIDPRGSIMFEHSGFGPASVNTKSWAPGIYYLSLRSGEQYWVKRLLIL